MAIGDDILRERLNLREQILMQQADALDVKASILLVAVTFLAGHSMYLLSKQVCAFIRYDQFASVFFQMLSGVVLAWHLRIRSYKGETAEELGEWRDKVVSHFGSQQSPEIEAALNKGIVDLSLERISLAVATNKSKAASVEIAYWITLAAFFLNLAAVIALLV